MANWLNISICEYNPPVILLGLAFMAIAWYLAHCVKCQRVARKVISDAGRKIGDAAQEGVIITVKRKV